MSEILADNGDLYVVRHCDADDGCTVLERFTAKSTGDKTPIAERDPEQCIDIPADVIREVIVALQEQKGMP